MNQSKNHIVASLSCSTVWISWWWRRNTAIYKLELILGKKGKLHSSFL